MTLFCPLSKKEVWLRNARSMNDFSEIEYGESNFQSALIGSQEGNSLRDYLNTLHPRFARKLQEQVEGWMPTLNKQTYILCVSEHDDIEDTHGRLSMWRAYGQKHSVALVFKNHPFLADTDAFRAYSFPVEYQDLDFFQSQFASLESRMRANQGLIEKMSDEDLLGWMFQVAKMMILCTKHPGFKEEREWRVIHCPDIEPPSNIISSIECLNGVPQQIYKIPLQNIPDENFNEVTIPEVLDRIIIGPSDEAPLLLDSFRKLLSEAGCEDVDQKVHYSGIPLRQ